MRESINVKKVKIQNNAVLVWFEARSKNKVSLLTEMVAVVAFVSGYLGDDDWKLNIITIGAQAETNEKKLMYVASSIKAAKAAGNGDAIFWLKNSIIRDYTDEVHQRTFLVEGDTEFAAFPILFEGLNFPIKAYGVYLMRYSEENIRSVIKMAKHVERRFFILFDKDKEKIVDDLVREGLLKDNYHVIQNGEFEDQIPSEILAETLNELSPGIDIPPELIDNARIKGERTMKAIERFYHEKGNSFVLPRKPELGELVATRMVSKNRVSEELKMLVKKIVEL